MNKTTEKIIKTAEQLQSLLDSQEEILAVRLSNSHVVGKGSSHIQFSGYKVAPSKFEGWESTLNTKEGTIRKETPLCNDITGIVIMNIQGEIKK